MNRSKKLYILLGVLVLVCVATFAVTQFEEHQEQIRTSEDVILEVPADSVRSLSWEYEGNTLAFHKDETWLYDEDEAFPVSEERIQELLKPFQAFGVSFTIENVEDYSQYGLDDPVCTIDLATEDQSWQIQLGDYSTMDSKRYVSIGDGNVYLVQNDPLDDFDASLSDMIDNDEAPSFENVTEIRFEGEENYSIAYRENNTITYSSDDHYFAQLDGTELPLDTSKVDSYLGAISSMSLNNYMTYNATEEELRTFGLDSPELTVTVDYMTEDADGNAKQDSFVMHVSRDPDEKNAADDSEEADEDITAYVRVGQSQIVYQLLPSEYRELMAAAYDDLRHGEVFWGDFTDVRQIEISLEGEEYTLTAGKDGDNRTWLYQGEKLEIEDLQDALEALSADSFTSEAPTQQEEISLTLSLDNENQQSVSIELYRYDGNDCLAVVDGEPVSLVGRGAVVDLIEAVHAIVLSRPNILHA